MKQLITEDFHTSIEVVKHLNLDEVARIKSKTASGREDGDDSFFVCDLGDVVLKHQRWQLNFPRIHPFFAIKCNPSEALLRCMIAMGTGFDCASKVEIDQMLKLGARPDQIIFANPCKQSSHIRFAKKHGIKNMVFDNEIELLKIKKIYPDANLVLRIMTDDSASICRFSMKYGAHADSCKMLIDTAKQLQLNVIGVSFHVGSGCQDPSAFVKALHLAREVFDYSSNVGYNLDLLDIGGGFPGTSDAILSFEEIADTVNRTLDKCFPTDLFPNLRMIAEPGRFYAASAFTLVTNVIAKRKVARDKQTYQDETAVKDAVLNSAAPTNCDEPAFMYFLNDGLYGSFNCLFYDHAEVKPTLMKKPEKALEFSSSIWGPTCDGLDRVIENCTLSELQIGDWILWKDMGAYTVAAGSAFNGFKTSMIYYFISSNNLESMKSIANNSAITGLSFHWDTEEKDKVTHPIVSMISLESIVPGDPLQS